MLCISNNPNHTVCSRVVPIIRYIQISAVRHRDISYYVGKSIIKNLTSIQVRF